MKASDFSNKKTFSNMFVMLNFCKGKYTNDNSLLIDNEDGTHTLYYNVCKSR